MVSERNDDIAPVHLRCVKSESISGALIFYYEDCHLLALCVGLSARRNNLRHAEYLEIQVREITLDMMTDTNYQMGDTGLRWQSSAILALQEATEAFLVHLFEDA